MRRRYRRNPGLGGFGGGLVRTIVRGAQDGLVVTLGSGLTNLISSKVPVGQTSTAAQAAVQLAVGTAGAMVMRKVTRSDRVAAMYLAGAYSNILRKLLAPVPVIGPALSGVGTYYMPSPIRATSAGMSAYPRLRPSNSVAGYPAAGGAAPALASDDVDSGFAVGMADE